MNKFLCFHLSSFLQNSWKPKVKIPLFLTKFWPFLLPPLCFRLFISYFFSGLLIYAETFLNRWILDHEKRKLGFPIFFNLKLYLFCFRPFVVPLIYGEGSFDRICWTTGNRTRVLSLFTPETFFFCLSAPELSLAKNIYNLWSSALRIQFVHSLQSFIDIL